MCQFQQRPSDTTAWVAHSPAADRFVTIQRDGDGFTVSETRRTPEGKWSGCFHGSCATFAAAEAAGLAILASAR
jgi:hypothetical protein